LLLLQEEVKSLQKVQSMKSLWLGHSKSDAQLYREKEEVELWKEKCPIKRHREYLLENKIFSEKELEAMQQKGEKSDGQTDKTVN
jgi:TPP-dependent pyruvate/acetoin dehydrogenase alpha subunit